MAFRYDTLASPIGTIYIVFDEMGVHRICLSGESFRRDFAGLKPASQPIARQQLRDYFLGTRRTFEMPLLIYGSDFQASVWRTLRAIPYGETRSYAWVARQLGKPDAARAVGNAVGDNPAPIVVPCHRVIKSDGSLGGYSADVEKKRWLLQHERGKHL
ncbi:MAG: methylated-DNA--[protein]-cysteine S-methyltransferase [Thermoplasmatota archaeon]